MAGQVVVVLYREGNVELRSAAGTLLQRRHGVGPEAVVAHAWPLERREDANQRAAPADPLHLAERDPRLVVAGAEIGVAGQRRQLQATRGELVSQPGPAIPVHV